MVKQYIVIILMLSLLLLSVSKAQETRDYAITEIRYVFESDDAFKVIVVVENQGADAIAPADVFVTLVDDDNRELIRDTLEPLSNGQTVIFEIPFNSINFPAGTEQTIQVAVGIDAYELANTEIASDNINSVIVPIPQRTSLSVPEPIFQFTDGGLIFWGEQYTRLEAILGIGAGVAILLLLWVITIILRLLFRRPARFGAWQPAYGLMPMYDQQSVEGRRWAWQQHAQNSLLLAPPRDGYIHPTKLLMGVDGRNLQDWKISGLRLSHYDTYGRISRTQAISDKKWLRRLNKIIEKRSNHNEEKLQSMLRPIADNLAKQFAKNIKKKNAFLPVAFDIRWEGKHGEVRITFELYQFKEHVWYRIDRWEPMMQVLSQKMQENFTFTIHGKEPHEKMRNFRERLRDDLIWLLLEMMRVEQTADQNDSQPVARQEYDIPDTLSDIQPIPTEEVPFSLPTNA